MWLEFWSNKSGEELARLLAPHIWPDTPVNPNVPFRSDCGPWWELSMNNDHKLDERDEVDAAGRRRFTYRDRYHPADRMARIEQVLRDLGVHGLRRT